MTIDQIIEDKAENDSGFAIAWAILKLRDVLDYDPGSPPHPFEALVIEIKELTSAINNLSPR